MDWHAELSVGCDQATRMLGVTQNPTRWLQPTWREGDADEMGVGDTFRLTPVSLLWTPRPGNPVPDPFSAELGLTAPGCIGMWRGA